MRIAATMCAEIAVGTFDHWQTFSHWIALLTRKINKKQSLELVMEVDVFLVESIVELS